MSVELFMLIFVRIVGRTGKTDEVGMSYEGGGCAGGTAEEAEVAQRLGR